MKLSRLLMIWPILASPVFLLGQKKEDIQSLQRDVAQLQDQVRQLQKSQDDKLGALQSTVEQAIAAAGKMNTAFTGLEQMLGQKLVDQQAKMVAPLATMGTKVDQMSDDFARMQQTVADLGAQLAKMDSKLADISSAVRTLSSQPAAPPPAQGVPGVPGAAPLATAPQQAGPPAGVTAQGLYQSAYGDFMNKQDDAAMKEFQDYLTYFGASANAPLAQYYIGEIYYRANQFPDAAKAFDAVGERFAENDKSADALYMKGVSLMKGGQKTDAATEFRNVIAKYPHHPDAAKAKDKLVELGFRTSTPARRHD